MIRKLLCWLGLHEWSEFGWSEDCNVNFICKYCGAIKR